MSDLRNFTLVVGGSKRWRRLPVRTFDRWYVDRRVECQPELRPDLGLDRCGRRRSAATDPNFRRGVKPANAGLKYPAQILAPDEIHALMEACGPSLAWRRYVGLIAFLYSSGARISEALAVTLEDLDRQRHRVLIRRGKGGRSRYVQMNDWGFDMVEAWLELRAALPPGPVFCITCGPTKGGPWSPAGVRQGLVGLKARAGVTKRVHPHCFRHTLACELMVAGFPLSYIQHALGHLNPATTATYLVAIGAVESLDTVAARPAPAFALATVVSLCPSCDEPLAAGVRLCDPCLDRLLATLTPPAEVGVLAGANASHEDHRPGGPDA